METLSNVRTLVGIAQDILAALETASRSMSRCERIARRVRCLRDILREVDEADDDAAMRSLRDRLEEALSAALRQVRRCQRSGFLGALFVAGGRMADPLDDVEGEIDRCVQDLTVASYVRIARLEEEVRQQNVLAACSSKVKDAPDGVPDKKAEEATVIGVPVCTVGAGTREHDHEVVPLPSYGCGDGYWRVSHGHGTCDCWHDYATGPSDAASYYPKYSPYPSMFSDDNPNACVII